VGASAGSAPPSEIADQTKVLSLSWPPEKYDGSDIRRDPREDHDLSLEYDDLSILTAAESSLFQGFSDADFEAIQSDLAMHPRRRGPGHLDRPRLIKSQIKRILGEARGPYLASAKYVGAWLVDRNLHRPVCGFWGIGDAMGAFGLNLAYIRLEPRRYYSLLSAGMSPQDKKKHQVALDSARRSRLLRLVIG
jgi:hypothetical protein